MWTTILAKRRVRVARWSICAYLRGRRIGQLYQKEGVCSTSNSRNRTYKAKLNLDHLTRAENILIRESQRQSFLKELQALENRQPIPKNNRLLSVMPIPDSHGLIRVQGRDREDNKVPFYNRPLILDGKHPATRLLLKNYHEK